MIQNKVGRVALGENRHVCVEAVRGDMGWSTFIERGMNRNSVRLGNSMQFNFAGDSPLSHY